MDIEISKLLKSFNYEKSFEFSIEDLDELIEIVKESLNIEDEIYIQREILNFFDLIILDEETIIKNNNIVKYLLNKFQPEQRSPEWFEMREGMITASDLATAINENPYSSPFDLIKKKCKLTGYQPNKFTEWGVKYEPVADLIYEYKYHKKIIEFGLLKHDTIDILGASPDGITNDGIMVEIKCPFSREITGIVPHYYWVQIQIQLEVCDLEWCHFEECGLAEYETYEEFLLDTNDEGIQHLTFDNMNKGIVLVAFDEVLEKNIYFYSPIKYTIDELDNWTENKIDEICEMENVSFSKTTWWKLHTFSCVKVKRDPEWFQETLPKIYLFWKDLIYYKSNVEELMLKVEEKKKSKYLFIDDTKNNEKEKLEYLFINDEETNSLMKKNRCNNEKKKLFLDDTPKSNKNQKKYLFLDDIPNTISNKKKYNKGKTINLFLD